LFLSIEPHWGRLQKVAIAITLIAMTAKIGDLAVNWVSINRQSKQIIAMGAFLPEGASVFVLPTWGAGSAKAGPRSALPDDRYLNIPQFWTLSRRADVSNLFALPGQDPLIFRQLACHGPYPPQPEWFECLESFDFVLTVHPAPIYRQALERIGTLAATKDMVTLWRVNRTTGSGQRSP